MHPLPGGERLFMGILRTLLASVLSISFLAACTLTSTTASPVAGTNQASQAAPSDWKLEFTRSGGFAGLRQKLWLSSNGELRAVDERKSIEVSRRALLSEVEKAGELMAKACPFEPKPQAEECRDCFNYNLDVELDGQKYSMQASDSSKPSVDLQALIVFLVSTLEQTLGNQP
jgi:hypothetical protein